MVVHCGCNVTWEKASEHTAHNMSPWKPEIHQRQDDNRETKTAKEEKENNLGGRVVWRTGPCLLRRTP